MDTSTLAFESVADLAIQLREGSINSTSLVEQVLSRYAGGLTRGVVRQRKENKTENHR